ncbi:hypothetical protein SAMN05880590_10170 [Rhizobium sp. RU35A]|uniref:hypothetical protein n=1 Tax=Rhizobium sp. RU35A TaxID=1907414 RepID=UPI000954E1F2|nr:hypothetical protein [Rhizobium sp. RU35A]SIP89760.1 hypothetical protein SAMN05880590_10170 [Rhizobium sp. RU35A]
MNKTLIWALDGLNNLLAIGIVILCTVAGYGYGETVGSPGLAILGFMLGILAAAVVCGLLAILIEIEKHLRKLATPPQEPKA